MEKGRVHSASFNDWILGPDDSELARSLSGLVYPKPGFFKRRRSPPPNRSRMRPPAMGYILTLIFSVTTLLLLVRSSKNGGSAAKGISSVATRKSGRILQGDEYGSKDLFLGEFSAGSTENQSPPDSDFERVSKKIKEASIEKQAASAHVLEDKRNETDVGVVSQTGSQPIKQVTSLGEKKEVASKTQVSALDGQVLDTRDLILKDSLQRSDADPRTAFQQAERLSIPAIIAAPVLKEGTNPATELERVLESVAGDSAEAVSSEAKTGFTGRSTQNVRSSKEGGGKERMMLVTGVDSATCTTARGTEIEMKGVQNKMDYAR
jgi:hypothetical protein